MSTNNLKTEHIYVLNFGSKELILDEALNDEEAVKLADFILFNHRAKKGALTDRISYPGEPLIRIVKEWK